MLSCLKHARRVSPLREAQSASVCWARNSRTTAQHTSHTGHCHVGCPRLRKLHAASRGHEHSASFPPCSSSSTLECAEAYTVGRTGPVACIWDGSPYSGFVLAFQMRAHLHTASVPGARCVVRLRAAALCYPGLQGALAQGGSRGYGPPRVGKQHGLSVGDVKDEERRPVSTRSRCRQQCTGMASLRVILDRTSYCTGNR